jgi:hypothetical protein
VLERFPVAVAPVMELAAGIIIMGPSHCDSLELGLQVVNEALEECLKSVGFSEVEPGCVRREHGGGFHGWWSPSDVFGVCSGGGTPTVWGQ